MLKRGDLVDCTDSQGNRLLRKVVAIGERVVYICTLEEFANAESLGVEPTCIGFPHEDVTLRKI